MYYVYLLKSQKDGIVYTGMTRDLKTRLQRHNEGSGYTKGHLPFELQFYSAFPSKKKAAEFERYLKTASGKAFANKRLLN